MRIRQNVLKVKWLQSGKVSLYCRGKRQFTGTHDSARHFAIGFGSPIDTRDVQSSKDFKEQYINASTAEDAR